MARLRGICRRLLGSTGPRRVVAAVAVRASVSGELEFLLVRTSDGERWTFPKGGCEPGETLVQAAAREAIEEAGATGQIGDDPIAEYQHGDAVVTAFLLVVQRDDLPPESARDPSWFDFEGARSNLAIGRAEAAGAEMERVLVAVQSAVAQ